MPVPSNAGFLDDFRRKRRRRLLVLGAALIVCLFLTALWRIALGEWRIPLSHVFSYLSPFLPEAEQQLPEALVCQILDLMGVAQVTAALYLLAGNLVPFRIKFLAAVLVIAIHTDLIKVFSSALAITIFAYLESLAVPFFFTFSGFFIFKRIQETGNRQVIINELKKFLRLYVLLSVIYLPLSIKGWIFKYSTGTSLTDVILLVLRNYLFAGEQNLSWQLWYLLAMIYGLIFLHFFCTHSGSEKPSLMIITSILFFVFAAYLNQISYKQIMIDTIRNGRLFTAPAYLLLGGLVYKNLNTLIKKWPYGAVVIAAAITISFVFHIGYSTVSFPAYFSILWISAWSLSVSRPVRSASTARKASRLFYYSHMYFYALWISPEKIIQTFLFTVLMCSIFSWLYIYCKNQISIQKNKQLEDKTE